MTGADRLSLAGLDQTPAVELDPSIWKRNLGALRLQSPDFAAELEQVALPSHWRCVRALDGSLTFRIEEPAQDPAWLGGTAAPLARAEGLLGALVIGEQNAALPTLAAGAELRFLLDRLPPHRAVYVFENDLRSVAAVLRCSDYARDIERGRVIFVPPADEPGFLEHQLSAHPGLLPPGLIICLPQVSQTRLEQVRTFCANCASAVSAARARRLQELAAAPPATPAATRPPRLAVLALQLDPAAQHAARALEDAARKLDWPLLLDIVAGPQDVHPLVHAERLASFAPNLIVSVGHPFELPLRAWATVCEWHLRSDQVAKAGDNSALKLGASPHVSDLLRRECRAGTRVFDWYWGCQPCDPTAPPKDVVLLVGDLPDDDPARAGIEQPSHVLLWNSAQRCAAQLWFKGELISASIVLKRAESAVGLSLPPGETRAALLRAIERTLIPATLLRTIRQALSSGAFGFGTIGHGWTPRANSEREAIAFCSIWDFMSQAKPYRPIAAVFLGIDDPLSPALVQAGALGWPLLLYGSGPASLSAGLSPIFRAADYRTFNDPRSLALALQDYRRDPGHTLARAGKTAQQLSARHSYTQRLRQLGDLLP